MRAPGGVSQTLANPLPPPRAAQVIADLAARCGPFHAVAITGGEPLEQEAFLAALLPRLSLPVLLETAGTLPEALAGVIDRVSVVSMDLKLPSVARIAPCFDLHRRFLEIALARVVYVKVVVNEQVDAAEWREAAHLVAAVAPAIPFIVQPETDRRGRCRPDFARLFALAAEASAAGLADVRVLPQVHKILGAP
ncbi:MAG: 7-carboxy-7-deazaguanine synthase QueE [Planctomycetes bacterium]|nr:7-carboxy-7-deazaguanine synthase QueE [Planctomycetota bacterium]